MKINYLKSATNLQELKTLYFKLAKEFHPDVNPQGLEAMKIINNEYDYLKGILKNAKDTKKAEQESTTSMEGFKNIIDELMKYPNIKIEIVNAWLWVSGYGTFKIKEDVLYNMFNFKYSKSNKKFYWYEGIEENETKYRGGFLKQAIDKYGITEIKSNVSYQPVLN